VSVDSKTTFADAYANIKPKQNKDIFNGNHVHSVSSWYDRRIETMVSFLVFHDPQLDAKSEMPMGMYINGKMHHVRNLSKGQVASEIKRMKDTDQWNAFDIGMIPRSNGISKSGIGMKLKNDDDIAYEHIMSSFHDIDGKDVEEIRGVQSFRGGYPGNEWDTTTGKVRGCYTVSRPEHYVGPNVIGQAGPLVFTAESFQEKKYIACNLMMDVKVHNLINPGDTEAKGIKDFFDIPDDKWDTIKYIQIARSVHVYADPPTFGYKNRKMHVVFFGRNSIIDITVDIGKSYEFTQRFHGIVSDVTVNGNNRSVCKYNGDGDPWIVSDGNDMRINDMPITPPVPDGWDINDTPSLFGLGVTHGQNVHDTNAYKDLKRVLDANRPPRTNAEYHENISLIRWVESMRNDTDPVFIVRGYSNSNDDRENGWYKWENWDDPIEKGQEQNDYCAFHRFDEFPRNAAISRGMIARHPITNVSPSDFLVNLLQAALSSYIDLHVYIAFVLAVYDNSKIMVIRHERFIEFLNERDHTVTATAASVLKYCESEKSNIFCPYKLAYDVVQTITFLDMIKNRSITKNHIMLITRVRKEKVENAFTSCLPYSAFYTAVALYDIMRVCNYDDAILQHASTLRDYAEYIVKSSSQNQDDGITICDVNMTTMYSCMVFALSSPLGKLSEYAPDVTLVCNRFDAIKSIKKPTRLGIKRRTYLDKMYKDWTTEIANYRA
jgi:hypothetical protein